MVTVTLYETFRYPWLTQARSGAIKSTLGK